MHCIVKLNSIKEDKWKLISLCWSFIYQYPYSLKNFADPYSLCKHWHVWYWISCTFTASMIWWNTHLQPWLHQLQWHRVAVRNIFVSKSSQLYSSQVLESTQLTCHCIYYPVIMLSSRKVVVLEDLFTSPCPWTTSPCPFSRTSSPYPWPRTLSPRPHRCPVTFCALKSLAVCMMYCFIRCCFCIRRCLIS